MSDYKFKSEEESPKPKAKAVTKKTVCYLNNRKAPDGEILKVLKQNTKVRVVEEKDGWARLEDGTYVMSQYLK